MNNGIATGFVARLVSVSLICVGFAQFSSAGVIGSGYLANEQAREASIEHLQVLLASEAVANKFAAMGVDAELVQQRINGLSDAELLTLQQQIDENIAGGDALGVIGAVFLVLLILELVGVTDIFKSL